MRFDEKSKPQFVGSIKEFRTLMTHMVDQRNTKNLTFQQGTSASNTGQANMNEKTQTSPMDTSKEPLADTQSKPASMAHETPQKKQQHSGIDLPPHTPSNVTLNDSLPSPFLLKSYNFQKETPSKAEKNRQKYAAMWGNTTPLRNFGPLVSSEIPKLRLDGSGEACFGFADMVELNTPDKYPFLSKTSTPAGSPTEKLKPQKMRFDSLNIKPYEMGEIQKPHENRQGKALNAALYEGVRPASPASATPDSKVTPTNRNAAARGTTIPADSSQLAQQGAVNMTEKPPSTGANAHVTPPKHDKVNVGPHSPFVIVDNVASGK